MAGRGLRIGYVNGNVVGDDKLQRMQGFFAMHDVVLIVEAGRGRFDVPGFET